MRLLDLRVAGFTGLVITTSAITIIVALPTVLPGADPPPVIVLPVVVFLLFTVVVYRKRSRPAREPAVGAIRDAIPSWQYTGGHVESGWITRDGQERTLRHTQEQAAVREDR